LALARRTRRNEQRVSTSLEYEGENDMAICSFEYAAKVICGEMREQGGPLAVGRYVTEVNVYNPQERPVWLRKRLVPTFPPGEQREWEGELPLEEEHQLTPGRAIGVDCRYLGQKVPPGPFFIGFLVIESTESVDVTAVYTTSGLRELDAPGIAVEQIKERTKASEERR
jgi:hypothetical protein